MKITAAFLRWIVAVTTSRDAASSMHDRIRRERTSKSPQRCAEAMMDEEILLKSVGENRALLREMARLCLEEDAPRLMRELRTAVENENRTSVEFAAHALKGLVGEFRAESARTAAAAIEQTASSAPKAELGAMIQTFEREFEALATALRAYLRDPA